MPDEVLTDNGKQFTGKYGKPRPAEVLFDRICRKNGIEHLLTKVRSPTTTGKVERWHQSIQRELLDDDPPFASVAAAQAAVEAWRVEYNTLRPHQSLDMATPAERFAPAPPRPGLPLWVPPGLITTEPPAPDAATAPEPMAAEPAVTVPGAVELERAVPPCGNLSIGRQQFWFGPHRAGEVITFWIDSTAVHLSTTGRYLKSVPSRLSDRDLARLRRAGARPAGPPPARGSPDRCWQGHRSRSTHRQRGRHRRHRRPPAPGRRPAGRAPGHPPPRGPAGHVITAEGMLWRTVAFELPAANRARLQGARPAGPPPTPPAGPTRVERVVSCRGGIQVVGQRVQVGMPHAGQIVTVEVEDTTLRVLDEEETILKTVPRRTTTAVTRHKAYGHRTVKEA